MTMVAMEGMLPFLCLISEDFGAMSTFLQSLGLHMATLAYRRGGARSTSSLEAITQVSSCAALQGHQAVSN